MDLKGRKVTVIGLGNSGLNAALLLHEVGAEVRVTDSSAMDKLKSTANSLIDKGIDVETGTHTRRYVEGSDLVVVSPGIDETSRALRWAAELGIPVISELELGFNYCRGKIIAITGTNGKSTVVTLIGEMLKAGGKDAVVCGNIGNSLCGEMARIKEDTWAVIEVSSFQLERIKYFKPMIAVVLNITDDHLDRYKTFDDYYREKLKIFANQDKHDILILNHDAPNVRDLSEKTNSRVFFYGRSSADINGAYLKDGKVCVSVDGKEKYIIAAKDIRLKGLHNIDNVLVSGLVAALVGVSDVTIKNTVKSFKGLPHRFETIAMIDGVEYIDDSKGTTVDSTYRALESCDRDVILIAGGKDKKSDYSLVKDLIISKVGRLILIGEAAPKIKSILSEHVRTFEAKDLSEAVSMAHTASTGREIVLLSPMCSSFDMFGDYKERGEAFKKAVMGLKGSVEKAGVRA